MCVIIQRNKGVVLPYDKIATACQINGDGYGFIINDREKFSVIKHCDGKGNKPDEIMKLLEDAKDCDIALHLRFRTAGDINIENTHPYQVLSKDKDGVDLWFMHNGTLSDFKAFDTTKSDSRNLNEKILQELFRASLKAHGEKYLEQDWVKLILKSIKNDTSAFTFNDSMGNRLILPSNMSKEFDGWWASNEYSFRTTHTRYGSGSTTYQTSGTSKFQSEKKEDKSVNFTKQTETKYLSGPQTSHGGKTTNSTSVPITNPSAYKHLSFKTWSYSSSRHTARAHMSTALKMEAEYVKEGLIEAFNESDQNVHKVNFGEDKYMPFLQLVDLPNYDALYRLSVSDLIEMCSYAPDVFGVLIADLLMEKNNNTRVLAPIQTVNHEAA